MTELYPIKWAVSYLYYIDVLGILIAIFLIAHFFVLYYFYSYKPKKKIKKIVKKLPEKLQIPLSKIMLDKLRKIKINSDREAFFVEFNEILREYFDKTWVKNAENKNLSELEKEDINNEILEVFKQSYFMIFNEKLEDNLELRENIIKKAEDYFINKD